MNKSISALVFFALLFAACSPSASIRKKAAQHLFSREPFISSHTGISVYDVARGKSVYDYNGNKYFLPASNTKLFTLYAAFKYLSDSLPGLQYDDSGDTLFIYPTGDPSLLQPEFKKQPVIDFLKDTRKPVMVVTAAWDDEALGAGWSWDDYSDDYMPERSILPVYGNVIRWHQVSQKNTQPELFDSLQTFIYSDPEVNWKVRFKEDRSNQIFSVKRKRDENLFEISQGKELEKEADVPFITNGVGSALELLKDTVGKELKLFTDKRPAVNLHTIHSQLTDTLLRNTMFRSDNFYAEQLLLMVSQLRLGRMNDRAIIDTLLKTDLAGLPQRPTWVDGSGLSRYNLFTPQDFVWVLKKLHDEFGIERLKQILPGAGKGTLSRYYLADSGFVYAKTGTLTGQVALSGFLISKKNRLLIFSVLVNNHPGSATAVRRGVEAFLHDVRERF